MIRRTVYCLHDLGIHFCQIPGFQSALATTGWTVSNQQDWKGAPYLSEGAYPDRRGLFKEERDPFPSERVLSDRTLSLEFRL